MPSNPQDPSHLAQPASAQPEPRPDAASEVNESLFDRPDSPCIGICSTLFDDICQGCGRTAMEVSNWVFMNDAEKQAVWERITREGTARRFCQR